MFSIETYISRRKALKEKVGSGIILLPGNEESPMNYADNTYPFRQDSTFLYYVGIPQPKLVLAMDLDGDAVTLFGDEAGLDDIVWMGRLETIREKAARSGIADVRETGALLVWLSGEAKKGRTIHFLPPYRGENKLKLSSWLGISPAMLQEAASVPLIRAVVAQRSIKSAEEVAELEKAVNTSVDMHLAAMRLARPGMSERSLAAAIQQIAMDQGGNLAYPTIMTIRGEILHNHHQLHTIREGQMVLNDSGAETAMGYAGDLTRTFPVGKRFSTLQKEMYQIVLDALQTAAESMKPGVRYLDVHRLSCRVLAEGLKLHGLMKGDMEEAVAVGAHTLFFQCGTGHMLGLDVHDMEDLGEQYVGYTDTLKKNTTEFGLKSLRLGRGLEAGYVLTVEPGLYFIPELIDRWKAEQKFAPFINYEAVEAFRHFGGIRIEDDYLITNDGNRVLGKPLPKTVEEVEALRI